MFASLAGTLVPNDTNNAQDVFLRDRREGTTVRLPVVAGGEIPPGRDRVRPDDLR